MHFCRVAKKQKILLFIQLQVSLKNYHFSRKDVVKTKASLTSGRLATQKSSRNDDFSYKVSLTSQTMKRCFDKLIPNF